jgi:deoxyhypusine synthase
VEDMKKQKGEYLQEVIEHIDIKAYDVVPLVNSMSKMAFQARNLATAANIYDKMLMDDDCTIILSLAGSIFSAGMKKIVYDMIMNNMIDVIVSTGAIIVDMDFFEALGFKHYIGSPDVDDNELNRLNIDRIYDTFIDEDELSFCDQKINEIANSLEPRPYTSREFIWEMGKYLDENGCKVDDSVIYAAYQYKMPIFVPAFSDCSAGFGILDHQRKNPEKHVTIDSVGDFRELVEIVLNAKETGIFLVGGGVPKNFVQDAVLGGEADENGLLLEEARMHKYAIQVSLASEYDGALSGSTFKEASSWGKVEAKTEQMVFSEASIAMPLIVGYAYHKGNWNGRESKEYNTIFLKN